MKRHIHNLSYNDLSEQVVQILSKSGIVNSDCTWDEKSRLPFIGREMSPEEIHDAIRQTMTKLQVEKNDVVVVGGVPDVAFYVAQYAPPKTPVLVVIGKKTDGTFRIVGFREIIRSERRMDAIHVIH